jgi:hypothetical protein
MVLLHSIWHILSQHGDMVLIYHYMISGLVVSLHMASRKSGFERIHLLHC